MRLRETRERKIYESTTCKNIKPGCTVGSSGHNCHYQNQKPSQALGFFVSSLPRILPWLGSTLEASLFALAFFLFHSTLKAFRIASAASAFAWILLLLIVVVCAQAAEVSRVETDTFTLKFAGKAVLDEQGKPVQPPTWEACMALRAAKEAEQSTRTVSSSTFECVRSAKAVVKWGKAPPTPICTTPRPADGFREQACPSGTTGIWTQSHGYTQQPYPACTWTANPWSPDAPPAGMCAPVTTPSTTLRINSGGPAVSDYVADTHYIGGATSSNCQRPGTGIFLTRRYAADSFEYRIPVANGAYTVKLLTRECWNAATGLRIQRASIEGTAVAQYDTYTTANGGVISQERTVTVTDGVINVVVTAVTGDAILNGIDVLPASGPVDPPPTGTASLKWGAPTKNTDGTPLTNLAKYRIQYGRSADELSEAIDVSNPGVTAFVVDGLAAGTWYFGVRAVSEAGAESALSNVVSKVVQ